MANLSVMMIAKMTKTKYCLIFRKKDKQDKNVKFTFYLAAKIHKMVIV